MLSQDLHRAPDASARRGRAPRPFRPPSDPPPPPPRLVHRAHYGYYLPELLATRPFVYRAPTATKTYHEYDIYPNTAGVVVVRYPPSSVDLSPLSPAKQKKIRKAQGPRQYRGALTIRHRTACSRNDVPFPLRGGAPRRRPKHPHSKSPASHRGSVARICARLPSGHHTPSAGRTRHTNARARPGPPNLPCPRATSVRSPVAPR